MSTLEKKRNVKSKGRRRSSSSKHSEFSEKENYEKFNETSPFYVKTSKQMGRYMVANKNFKPGEIILREAPLVVGPCSGCDLLCIGCYKDFETTDSFTQCEQCSGPLCSQNCAGLNTKHGHTKLECSVLKQCRNSKDLSSWREDLSALVPLRCLLLKTTDPDAYRSITNMESHNKIRQNLPDVWEKTQRSVVDKIIKDWMLIEFSEAEVHKICGILEVNAFEIGHQVSIRALYPEAFLMSHNCIPNTNHTDEEVTFNLTVRAAVPIPENHPVTISYAYTIQNTLRRREHLLENKFFECLCSRCQDPEELGTFTGALICPKCKSFVLATNPLDSESPWACSNKNGCTGYSISSRSMQLLTLKITEEVDTIDNNDIFALENFLEKYRNVLNPSHYLCLSVKLNLSQLYGRSKGYLIHEMTEKMLQRKLALCKELLAVLDVIEPGFTKIRGVTLYELHAPLMILLTRQFEANLITGSEVKSRLKEVVKCLIEASIILGFEAKSSTEGIMGHAAKDALVRIRDWEKILGKL